MWSTMATSVGSRSMLEAPRKPTTPSTFDRMCLASSGVDQERGGAEGCDPIGQEGVLRSLRVEGTDERDDGHQRAP